MSYGHRAKYIILLKNDTIELMNVLMLRTGQPFQIRHLQNNWKNNNNKTKDTTAIYRTMIFIPNSQIWTKEVVAL